MKPRICSGTIRCSPALLAQLQASFPDMSSLKVGRRANFNDFVETKSGDAVFVQVGRDIVVTEVFGAIEKHNTCSCLISKLDRISIAKRLSKLRNVEQRLCLAAWASILGLAIYRKDGDVVSVIRCV